MHALLKADVSTIEDLVMHASTSSSHKTEPKQLTPRPKQLKARAKPLR